ncbi:Rieske (2Fe-2S) protein [Streptomyces sp. NPDC059373]
MKRRVLLAAMAALAGCAKYGGEGGGTAPASPAQPASSGGAPLAKAADIPVGGGTVLADRKLVVTQPTKGRFKAFSAVCTHQGCTVKDVNSGTINCPCHGSRFRITDASVAAGPAPRPLAEQPITVQGGEILLA